MEIFEELKDIQNLLEVIGVLLGPKGCPWDHAQTPETIIKDLIEETYELADAIATNDAEEICEELGDVIFVYLLLALIIEKQNSNLFAIAMKKVHAKMIARHPHVFGNTTLENMSEIYLQWEEIKNKESGKTERTSVLDGVSKSLPPLARAQKIIKKNAKNGIHNRAETNDQKLLCGSFGSRSATMEYPFRHADTKY